MRKIIALALVSGLTLTGCNTVAPVVTPTVKTTVSDIQSTVVAACGFLPAATTVATILNASTTVMTAAQIAKLVCDAVTTKGVHRGGYAPKYVVVNNKVILLNGEFVK